jgi:hypothetical protein
MVVAWIIFRAYRLLESSVKKDGPRCPRERTLLDRRSARFSLKDGRFYAHCRWQGRCFPGDRGDFMNSVRVAAVLAAALTFVHPIDTTAQERERAPRPAPPTTAPPPSEGAPADVAVPRSEASRPAPPPRVETPRNTTAEEGARRRTPVNAPIAAPPSNDSAAAQDRRGAVRRPPSDGGGGPGATPSRDRAVVRSGPPPRDYDGDHDRYRVHYYPSYYSYGRYPYYYNGFHVGYLAYAPWGWTPAFYGYPYGYGGPAYGGYGYDIGRLRIKVQPRDAEVYVDGYYAGTVDDFDGMFQSLRLETGGYRIEIRKPGFETLQFDVHVQPDRTVTYRGEMRVTP